MSEIRDALEWIGDAGGAIGGFASLLAVVIAVIALEIARRDRNDARADRAVIRRDREHLAALDLIRALRELDGNLRSLGNAKFTAGKDAFDETAHAMQTILAWHGLDDHLPITASVARWKYGDDWGAGHDAVVDNARTEIRAVIASETKRLRLIRDE